MHYGTVEYLIGCIDYKMSTFTCLLVYSFTRFFTIWPWGLFSFLFLHFFLLSCSLHYGGFISFMLLGHVMPVTNFPFMSILHVV